ncbi:MAG: transglycosylase SLT domain-containing protein, partial [Thermodesulfobacteriota bacterium]
DAALRRTPAASSAHGAAAGGTPARQPERAGTPQTDAWLRTERQRSLAGTITRAARHAGVDPALSLAVAVAESSLDPTARSADGLSTGTFQVTTATAADIRRRFASGRLERPPGADDVALGVAHLRYLDGLFADGTALGGALRTVAVDDPDERTRFALAAYNAGEGRVASAQRSAAALRRDPTRWDGIRAFLPETTRRYVDRVLRYAGRAPRAQAA